MTDFKDTIGQINRIDPAARQERISGPSIIQMAGRGGGGGGDAEFYQAYCKENAPAALVITCYLDYDGHTAVNWEDEHPYSAGEIVNGSDSKKYQSKAAHTSAAATCPVTGTDYAQKWEVISEIEVYCTVLAGGYLDTAIPQLIIGTPMPVYQKDDVWYSDWSFNGSIVCSALT
ncbi:MAG: hypothetical protein MUP16_05700 [Sedimentisphaerales bacterium]|nr:hypothetical protein [Sedimentisphaerales bacterium]